MLQQIEERQVELAMLIRSTNAKSREYALRATNYPTKPASEVIEAVHAEGQEIANEIRKISQLSADDPRFEPQLQDIRLRFRNWKEAWWGLSQRIGVDINESALRLNYCRVKKDGDMKALIGNKASEKDIRDWLSQNGFNGKTAQSSLASIKTE